MSKIAFIAPDKQLYLQGKRIIKDLGLEQKIDIYLARLKRAITLAQRLQNEDVDVIVCRGGTATSIIDSNIRIPVVEIPITGQDLAQLFHEAKKITGLPAPKLAMVAFRNMTHDIEVLSNILGINLTILPLNNMNDISTKNEEIDSNTVDVVAGGRRSVLLAARKGIKTLLVKSGDYSIKTALFEAKKIVLARKIEKEYAQEFKALVDFSSDGIISVNQERIIKVFNPTAERLLNLPAKETLGKNADTILSFINLNPCLQSGQEFIGQTTQVNNCWLSFNIAPIIVDRIITGAIITFQDITRVQEIETKIRNDVLARKFVAKYQFKNIIGSSPEVVESKRIAQEIAPIDATVLIYGESGTGKELFAQSIHNNSQRRNGPFVAINCAALPSNLLESELFGYVEGAFTGANKKGKQGLFEMAHRGTIFLDEISEMDKYGQNRLLRVLQEKQVMRLGDDKVIPVDVRIIAATNKNLVELISENLFRQDLFYRLKLLTLDLPPLRERSGDVKLLALHFVELFKKKYNKNLDFSPAAYECLDEHHWPGNVREFMYFIERLVIIANEKIITDSVVRKYWDRKHTANICNPPVSSSATSEKDRIIEALAECKSNISRTAHMLNMDRTTLYKKLRSYNIQVMKAY
ncbi:sigma 54-interacting transcriptional regulator [Sporomusa sp.]|uniref:sigma 54-interacting transcriptional regulator n=1 Tax=Sporomusa sp. TaxID=2078658 RepID=UPI002C7AC38F|nr:sigma 54-interacting transcriptional regulator [Sporomusa sp.]HWR44548.1 sigma 54-interacting transcriptional regulator [Sporomusa sp.]